MATELGPLPIEAPKPAPIVNENEHALVPGHIPGPVIPGKESSDSITKQPAGTSTFKGNTDKREIPPGFPRPATSPSPNNPPPPYSSRPTVLAAGEQQTRSENLHTNIETKAGSGVARVKGTRQKVQEIKREQAVCEQDGLGNVRMIKRTIIEQRIYTTIEEVLLIDASKFNVRLKNPTRGVAITEVGEDDEVNPTCSEKTIDLCCQSLVCHCQNPFGRNNANSTFEKKQLMNATRRRGRAKGWTILKGLIFPFVSDVTRDFWVSFQLLFALVLLSLSASIFALAGANYKVFHAVHLGFSVLAAFLAMLDWIVSFTQCSTCKACISRCREKAGKENSVDINEIALSDDVKGCRKCFVVSRSSIDIARVFLTEFILIPIIFCDMFEVATGMGFNSDVLYHRIGFALMVYDSIGLIVFVFLLRLVILGRMIHTEQRAHPTKEDVDINELYACQDYNVDWSIKKNSRKIQIVFFLHVFGQTLAHALMLVAVGAKIAYDNRDFKNDLDSPTVTGYLWYMLASAYILPTFGIGTFFIVNNYWVQQFLIGLCIDFVKVLQIIEDNRLFASSRDEKPSQAICKFVRIRQLEIEYDDMRNKVKFCDKVGYPFKSPVLVIVCILYSLAQFGFVLCSVFTVSDSRTFSVYDRRAPFAIVFLNDGGWAVYVFVAAVAGAIINIYSFVVAGIWIMIVAFVLAAIALLIAGCVCLVFAAAVGSDN